MADMAPQVHVRLKAINEIDEWADKHGLSRSDAINMMCVSYIDIERRMIENVRNRWLHNRKQEVK